MNDIKKELDIEYREIQYDRDYNFIYGNWIREYGKCGIANGMNGDHFLYPSYQTLLIKKLLGEGKVMLAYKNGDIGDLVGFVCYDLLGNMLILHYAYVKPVCRELGIYNDLLDQVYLKHSQIDSDERIILTHLGRDYIYRRPDGVCYLRAPYFKEYVYLPFKAFDKLK